MKKKSAMYMRTHIDTNAQVFYLLYLSSTGWIFHATLISLKHLMTVYRYFKLANISWPLNKRQNNNLNELRQFSQRMANQNVFYLSRLRGSHVVEEAKGTCSSKQSSRWVCHSAAIGPPSRSQQEPIKTLHPSFPKRSFIA